MSNWEIYHHKDCKHRHAPLGYPGCICKVVNKEDDLEYRISRLELHKGDSLVLKYKRSIPISAILRIKADVERVCPGVACLVLDDSADLSVLTHHMVEQAYLKLGTCLACGSATSEQGICSNKECPGLGGGS